MNQAKKFALSIDTQLSRWLGAIPILIPILQRLNVVSMKIPENVKLLFIPPYSPELNPIERLWQYIKDHLTFSLIQELETLKHEVSDTLDKCTTSIIASFHYRILFIRLLLFAICSTTGDQPCSPNTHLVMDGSPVGRGCRTLMLSVVYKKRALPLAWLVAKGSKGHFSEDNHITLIEQVKEIIPDAHVMFLGNGEFERIRRTHISCL